MIFLLEFVHVFIISLMLCVCAICGLISFSRDGEIWFEHESPDEWFERIIRERKKQRNNFLLTLVVTVIIIGGVLHSINNIRRTHIEPKKWVQVYKNSIDAKIKKASAAYVDAFLIFATFSDIIITWGSFGILVRLPLSWKRRQEGLVIKED